MEFEVGEKARWIVGMPGPDFDNCVIVGKRPDGDYDVKFQVYGSGPWHEGVGKPGHNGVSGLFKGQVEFNTL